MILRAVLILFAVAVLVLFALEPVSEPELVPEVRAPDKTLVAVGLEA